MSNLLARIKADSLEARKAGQKVIGGLLTTLYSEAAIIGKNDGNRETTDDEVRKVIRRFLKNNEDAQLAIAKTGSNPAPYLQEEAITLAGYLPPELTDEQIQDAIRYSEAFATLSMKSMPMIKAFIDEHAPGAYDGKRVSDAVRARIGA